ncbi:MAG TPA: metallophosphoesterase [Verrucomicrobiae bacterium]|nr:metallophosphoesterase [Verrucomicrobiae bacterium]
MPVTLPQLSRRAFLKRAGLAGAAATLAPFSYAGTAEKLRDQHTFALFSDPHIAADATAISRGVNMADNLAACVRELMAWPLKPAAVIVNGDLALKNGQPGDYVMFGKLIEPARTLAPLHLTLGNHDQRENFWQAFPQDAEKVNAVPQKQVAVYASARANWFVLDSLDKTDSTPGDLGEAQLHWLTGELNNRPDKPAIIVVHHNLQTPGWTDGLKRETPALDELFARQQHIKAFIFGHTHNWNISRHATGVHLINLPPTGYVFAAGHPSGWVRCTLASDGMEIELRSLDPKHPEHAQVKNLSWR